MPSKRPAAPKQPPAQQQARAGAGSADRASSTGTTEATAILAPPPATPATPGSGPQARGSRPAAQPNGRPAKQSKPAKPGKQSRSAPPAAAAAAVAGPPTAAPAPAPSGKGRKAPRRGRRVHRIIRRIDLWSVLKLSLVLYTCIYASVLMATAGLWAFLNSAGLVDKFESFMKDVGFNNWEFHGPQMFKGVAAGGAVLVLAGAVLTLVAVGLVNVVSELTGGIRVTVIEEAPVHVVPRRTANPTLAEWEADQQAARRPPG